MSNSHLSNQWGVFLLALPHPSIIGRRMCFKLFARLRFKHSEGAPWAARCVVSYSLQSLTLLSSLWKNASSQNNSAVSHGFLLAPQVILDWSFYG